MTRNLQFLQIGIILALAGSLANVSNEDFLPCVESASKLNVNASQMLHSGGCLRQFSTPCPSWEDPGNPTSACGCTGPNDTTSCIPAEAVGDDEEDAWIYHTGFPLEPYSGYGFGSSTNFYTLCTSFYTCSPECTANFLTEGYTCNLEQVSEFIEEGSKGSGDVISCDSSVASNSSKSHTQERLAAMNGVGLRLLSQE